MNADPRRVTLAVGDLFAARYRVERLLGSGGMGAVYLATHLPTGTPCALKLMHTRLRQDPVLRERFIREGQALAAIRHPAVVEVLELAVTPDGLPYIAMEALSGETLARRLRRGPMSAGELLPVVLAVADGLTALHARGIFHRDLKPSNIMLLGDGRAKLLDFGIAGFWGRERLTATGETVGTLRWMAPEMLSGSRVLDGRSDVYSLGVIVYEAIAGRHPFFPDQRAVEAILTGKWPPLTEASSAVAACVARAMSLELRSRHPTPREFADELARIVAAERTAPMRPSGPAPRARSITGALVAVVLLGMVLATGAGVVAALYVAGSEGEEEEKPRDVRRVDHDPEVDDPTASVDPPPRPPEAEASPVAPPADVAPPGFDADLYARHGARCRLYIRCCAAIDRMAPTQCVPDAVGEPGPSSDVQCTTALGVSRMFAILNFTEEQLSSLPDECRQ